MYQYFEIRPFKTVQKSPTFSYIFEIPLKGEWLAQNGS